MHMTEGVPVQGSNNSNDWDHILSYLLIYLPTYLLTYLLHGAQSFLRNWQVFS